MLLRCVCTIECLASNFLSLSVSNECKYRKAGWTHGIYGMLFSFTSNVSGLLFSEGFIINVSEDFYYKVKTTSYKFLVSEVLLWIFLKQLKSFITNRGYKKSKIHQRSTSPERVKP